MEDLDYSTFYDAEDEPNEPLRRAGVLATYVNAAGTWAPYQGRHRAH